ncbi:MAG: hypothetical protein CVU54_11730 [Deltaproteobacteria bacterium HGW-Deltaproteobacteria-12]|jgi:hypothetical protein|nr:MAG: hypothetical protein CVU54_11730 [Deltaproteobacteria bacterium HGW-Deltaproteobacteria-12]
MTNPIYKIIKPKWWLVIKLLPILLGFMFLKWVIHFYDLEFLTMNALFSSLIAGTVFLIGFLISGVLSDYKESEKIPGEIAACLDTLSDDALSVHYKKKDERVNQWLEHVLQTQNLIMDWLYSRVPFSMLLEHVENYSEHFSQLEDLIPANYIVRLKQEQSCLRKMLIRIQVIRDTSFVPSAYAIVESLAVLISIGLLLVEIEPFYESLFFLGFVVFLVLYMMFLIRDLDNPFEYSEHGETPGEIALQPMHEVKYRLKNKISKIARSI